ncbi:MAG: hypothetical protein IJ877_04430 [Candidatus Gastranaerophilales bacterium]|nr:hypothetical protein [Candidatus Gastranaerophilales bacterium]
MDMRISPVSIYCPKISSINFKKNHIQPIENKILKDNFQMSFLGIPPYRYSPVSSKISTCSVLNCDYSNQDDFCELFSDKINSQLLTPSKKDVELMILRLKAQTGADEETVHRVLYELTALSNYSAVDYFSEICKKYNTQNFGVAPNEYYDWEDFSLNCALNYLSKNKKMFKEGKQDFNSVVILDDYFLQTLKTAKDNDDIMYDKFINDIKHDRTHVINLSGWDVKCADGKYRSANFLLGSGFLESIAFDVIKKVQRGEKLDDILYSDFSKRLNDITGLDIPVVKLKAKTKFAKITQDDIYSNLKLPELNESDVRKNINDYTETAHDSNPAIFYCKYLDENSIVYSNNSYSQNLIKLYRILCSKYGKNHKYCVPNSNKSYGYIASIYAKLNQIPPKDVVLADFYAGYETTKRFEDSEVIILDDISATGQSAFVQTGKLKNLANTHNCRIHWALLLMTDNSIEFLKDFNNPDFIYLKKAKTLHDECSKTSLLTRDDLDMLAYNMSIAYGALRISCAFPYIIPDNASEQSAKLFDKLLMKSTNSSNKALRAFKPCGNTD